MFEQKQQATRVLGKVEVSTLRKAQSVGKAERLARMVQGLQASLDNNRRTMLARRVPR